ncbi:MAG: DEAD/DEAH box helicase, partial [Roseovarius sp.]|nr:DEAD/DEAH box helicase [Roseovarius sp.]
MPGAATLLRDIFGFDAFRPGQEEIVDAVADGQNVLAIMPTGGGKSLCFQLPALMRDGVTVV